MSPTNVTVSVIIPTYRRQHILCDTLRSVLAQDYPTFEVVVVDQTPEIASELRDLLEQSGGKIRYHRQAEPNLAQARNTGVTMGRAESLLFLDDDVCLPPNFIANHMKRLNASERIGAVTGPEPKSLAEHRQTSLAQLHATYGQSREERGAKAFRALWFPGCNFSVKRAALEMTGPFDETFVGTDYCGDVDISVRVRSAGFEVVFDCDAWLLHLALSTGGCEIRSTIDTERREREMLQHTLYCRMKHASFEGTAKTIRLIYKTYRDFVLNRQTILRGLRYAMKRMKDAVIETSRAYQRLRIVRESAYEQNHHPSFGRYTHLPAAGDSMRYAEVGSGAGLSDF